MKLRQYRKATGYYQGSSTRSPNGAVETCSPAFPFLVKTPGWHRTMSKELASSITYEWTEIGLWTQDRRDHSSILICQISDSCRTGLAETVRESLLTTSPEIPASQPFGWHAFILPHVSHSFYVAGWACRDLIREVETRRGHVTQQQTDYTALHEISRHAMHSTETLLMAVEVIRSILDDLDEVHAASGPLSQQCKEVRNVLRCQNSLLQCDHGRSNAL